MRGPRLLFLLGGCGLLLLLVARVGAAEILDRLRGMGWAVLGVLLPYLVVYALDTLGWRVTLPRRMPVSLARLFCLRVAGEALNALTPTGYLGGEPVKAWLLKGAGVPWREGVASVVVAKTTMLLAQAAFVALGVLLALVRGAVSLRAGGSALAAVAGIALLLALFAVGQRHGLFGWALGCLRRLRLLPVLVPADAAGGVDEVLRGFYAERSGRFFLSAVLHFLGWVVGTVEVLLILGLLRVPVDVSTALAMEALVSVAKAAGFFVPGGLGVQEGGIVVIFLAFHLAAPAAITYGLVRRAREALWAGLGVLILVQAGPGTWRSTRGRLA